MDNIDKAVDMIVEQRGKTITPTVIMRSKDLLRALLTNDIKRIQTAASRLVTVDDNKHLGDVVMEFGDAIEADDQEGIDQSMEWLALYAMNILDPSGSRMGEPRATDPNSIKAILAKHE